MKISYVTTYDAMDIHNWSGNGYSIAKMLENQSADIHYIGNLRREKDVLLKIKEKYYRRFSEKAFHIDREPNVIKRYAQQVQTKMKINTDIVFSPGSIPIALLKTRKPKVFYTDATFAGMLGFYDCYSNLCSETIKHGNYFEQMALESSKLVIYSSDWAAKTAIDNYNINPDKIKVVPFGANNKSNCDLEEIKNIISNRSLDSINLLFLGVEWKRKGGDFAVRIARELNILGIKTTLHIVGIREIPLENIPEFVVNHGFISKATDEGNKRINELLSKSHFLLVPSIAEAFGIVFCEASSFGLPSITTNIGGIPTVIRNDINGKMFSLNDDVKDWCDYIATIFTDKAKYNSLCLSAFGEYEDRLNWNVAGKTIMKLLKKI